MRAVVACLWERLCVVSFSHRKISTKKLAIRRRLSSVAGSAGHRHWTQETHSANRQPNKNAPEIIHHSFLHCQQMSKRIRRYI